MGPGSHLLLGGTGEGKTSLLEAMYLVLTTRSFRTSRLSDCLAHDVDPADGVGLYVVAEVEDRHRARLEFGWNPSEGSWRRLNGDRSTLEEHIGQQPVLAWSGADIDVLVGAPDLRRRLVDRVSVGLAPVTLGVLGRYRRALEQKRALLAGRTPSLAEVSSFNAVLARAAEEVILRRRRSVERLCAGLAEVGGEFPREDFEVGLTYRPSPARADDAGEGWSLDAFEERSAEEIRRRRPVVGPHRDRIEVLFRGRPVAESASAGERKAVGMLLLAAQARVLAAADRPPVLLVDDVDTEMDQGTLEAVWPLFRGSPQTLVSSNRESVFCNLDVGSVWRVGGGAVGPV